MVVFSGPVESFDDGEGGVAFGQHLVVKRKGSVVFDVVHVCGTRRETLDIATPMRRFDRKAEAIAFATNPK